MRLSCSVIIPTFRRAEYLIRTLKCIRDVDSENFIHEIVIVDQTPISEVPGNLKGEIDRVCGPVPVYYVHLSLPNLPNARNIGLLNSKGDICIYFDDDVLLSSNFFRSHLAAYHDSEICAVASQVYHRKPTVGVDSFSFNDYQSSSIKQETRALDDQNSSQTILYGTCFSVKRTTALSIGGFDRHFAGAGYYEDSDFSRRLSKSGAKLRFCEGAFVLHYRAPAGGCRWNSNADGDAEIALFCAFLFLFRHPLSYGSRSAIIAILSIVRRRLLAGGSARILILLFRSAVRAFSQRRSVDGISVSVTLQARARNR